MNVFAKVAMGSLALCLAVPAWAQSAEWTVSEANGRVVVRDAAGDHPVVRGAMVRAGTTLLTGASSRAVLVRGEDFVTVSAASRVRVPDAKAPGLVQLFLEWGTGLFKVKHTDKPHFGVQTPYLAAVVKGTTFTVTVGQEGTSLQVIDGAVGVATIDGGANELIRPGMVAMISSGDRYRLSVQGQQNRVIDSPLRETAPATPSPEIPPAPKIGETNKGDEAPNAAETGLQKGADDFAWSDVSNSVITQPIEAKPVDISAATGGLVSNGGSSSTSVAVVAVVPVARGKDGSDGAAPVKGSGEEGKGAEPGKGSGGDGKGAEPGKGSGDDGKDAGPGKGSGSDDKGAGPGKDPGGDGKDAGPGKGSGGDDKGAGPGKGSGDDKDAGPGKGSGDDGKDAGPGKGSGDDGKDAGPGKGSGGDDKGAGPGKDPGGDGKDAGPGKGSGGDDKGAGPGKDPGGDGKDAGPGKDPGGSDKGAGPENDPGGDSKGGGAGKNPGGGGKGTSPDKDPGGKGGGADNGNGGGPGKGKG